MSNLRGVGIGIGAAAAIAVGVGVAVWAGRDRPPEAFADATFTTLEPERTRWIRLQGQAHYPSTITQRVPETAFRPARTYYVFAFFPEHQTDAREIPVLVRTQRQPDRIVSYEAMTIEGRLVPPGKQAVPPGTESMLGEKRGYFFAEPLWVLEPVRIVSEDGVWEEPGWE